MFKGKAGGCIENEFIGYNNGGFYAVQGKAWMDERVMKIWIERILKLYLETSIMALLEDAGTETKHVSGGCT